MRLFLLTLAGVLAGAAGTAAVADGMPPHHGHAVCGCHRRATPTRRHHVVGRSWSRVSERTERYAYGPPPGWREHAWPEDGGWRFSHGWRSDGYAMGWARRPWATDAFGFLTWPGKSHFVDGRYAPEGAMPPPPPPPPGGPEMAPPPPGEVGPPPPGEWQGPPPPPGEDQGSYQIYRF